NGFPFVLIGHCEDNTGLSFIDLDFETAVLMSVEYLYKLGHRQIGIFNLAGRSRENSYGPLVRSVLGYQRACALYNLTPIIYEAMSTIEETYLATQRMLDDYPQMTAVVTMHTDSSVGIVRAAQDRGLHIPRDLSLVSIVADRIANLISPPLTAISLPAYQMGERAAQMLIRMLQNEQYEPEQELLKPHLVIRESTGPVRLERLR
ncbi:MAG: substrate-binding domain-containing protein, partial [Anaerolineae bacterium]|nr:substrate-binding domain-containing protein [Anaerolineae bacterium]